MAQTRRKLLDNFDEEVHEKLKIKDRESSDYLTRFETWLWQLTRCSRNRPWSSRSAWSC